MKIVRHAFVPGLLCCLLFLSLHTASAQSITPRTYIFVEVKTTSGQAVADAAVKVTNADGQQVLSVKTSKDGTAKADLRQSPNHHYDVQISKSGYLPFEEVYFPESPYGYGQSSRVVEGIPNLQDSKDSRSPPVKILLIKNPVTQAERHSVEVEGQKHQLLLAAKRGDAAGFRKLLEAGAQADTVDAKGVPAIAWAAYAGDPATIGQLLAAGATVRNKNSLAHQALLIYLADGIYRYGYSRKPGNDKNAGSEKAFRQRHEEIVRLLTEAGAGINVRDSYRGTVLNKAIIQIPHSLSIGTIKALITAGADVNAVDQSGHTPLMLAVGTDSLELIQMLFRAGAKASINTKDKGLRTALTFAAGSRPEVGKALIAAGADVNSVDESGQTPLMLAAKGASINTVQTLLQAGAIDSINTKDKEGQTALTYAVTGYRDESTRAATAAVVKALLVAGANINDVDARGRTALMYAAGYHDSTLEVVKTMIAAGSNVNAVDEDGHTALMSAAQANSIRVIQTLLQAGARASVNAKDKKGGSALLYAVAEYSSLATEIAQALIAAGANVNDANADGQTPLMIAAQRNSVGTVKVLLAAGASTNAKDKQGRTALMHVRSQDAGGLEVAQALIAAGANVNEVNAEGMTPLMIAASQEFNLRGIQTLLETGARATINAKDNYGRTALICATYSDPEAVTALIDAGANVNEVDARGVTALMYAASGYRDASLKIVRVLITAGANVNAADANGRTALLHIGYNYSRSGIFQALIGAGANINAPDKVGKTPLMSVAQGAPVVEITELALESGARASINSSDKDGKTALFYAVSQNYGTAPEVVKALIAAGANVNEVDASGRTPLMSAVAERDSLETIKVLLAAGAAIDAKDKGGQTALKHAVIGHRDSKPDSISEAVKTLIAAKADVNEVYQGGLTTLMLAARTGNLKTTQALLGAGAAVNSIDQLGQTALMYAAGEYYSSAEVVKALLAAGANANDLNKRGQTPLMLAAPTPSLETIKTLLAAHATLNAKDNEGKTALMYATFGYRDSGFEIVTALLAAGAQVDAVDEKGQTSLLLAAKSDSLETIRALLAAGASIKAKDKEGQTALMHAASPPYHSLTSEIIEALIAAGANVNTKDNQGRTALMIARQAGNETIVKLLEETTKR